MPDQDPTGRELELLKILWLRGPATVRQIYDELHAQDTQLAYTTVLSLLQTMERKGFVRHRASGKAYLYSAAVERDSTTRDMAASFLERVFDGAIEEYLVRALESRSPSEQELAELEAMIAAHKSRTKSKRAKKGRK